VVLEFRVDSLVDDKNPVSRDSINDGVYQIKLELSSKQGKLTLFTVMPDCRFGMRSRGEDYILSISK
jgi:hypothetical protein